MTSHRASHGVRAFFAVLLAGFPVVVQAADTNEAMLSQMVTGTLMQLDLVSRKGTVNTDLGSPITFDITKPQLFELLPLGSRVTIEMNSDGGADRVAGAAMADILSPAHAPNAVAIPGDGAKGGSR